jgi:LysR family tcuABC transcriptional regulator
MDLRQLRYFVQIVESGSLSKASRELHIAQPALTQRMTQLEENVGKPLLIRSSRGVVPTPNGLALYNHAKFVLRQIEEATIVARQEHADFRGRVNLGLVASTASVLAMPLLKRIKDKYPDIAVHLISGPPEHLENLSRIGELDLAVVFRKLSPIELSFDSLLLEEVAVMLPQESDLVPPQKLTLTLDEVAALPLVMAGDNQSLRNRMTQEFERADLNTNIIAVIDSLHLIMRYIAEVGGVTIQTMAAAQVHAGVRWRCLPISNAQITRTNYLCSQPLRKLSTAADAVRAELKDVAWSLVKTGVWKGVRFTAAMPDPYDEFSDT